MDFGLILHTINSITPDRPWGPNIPNYFWCTSSSAAAYIISCFSTVFKIKEYQSITGFSLLLSFALLVGAPLNLIDDLRQPGHLINFFLYGWENFPTSPMKWGVLLLVLYGFILITQSILYYQSYFRRRTFSKEEQVRQEDQLAFVGAIGLAIAIGVESYTGYIVGSLHAIALFHTPIMPILFLVSAMVSGTGLLIILLPLFQKFFTDFKRIDKAMMQRLARLLAWFIVIDLVIRFFWLTFAITFNSEEKYALKLFFGENFWEVLIVDYIICLLVPMIIGFTNYFAKSLPWVLFAGSLSAIGVWIFRWNTVIGGQSIGKTTPFLLEYHPHPFGSDSIMSVISNWSLLIALVAVVMVVFPWDKEMANYYVKQEED